MKLIKFRRLNGKAPISCINGELVEMWEIAFNEAHLYEKLGGDQAEIIMPAKPWYIRLWRKFFSLKSVEVPADGKIRECQL